MTFNHQRTPSLRLLSTGSGQLGSNLEGFAWREAVITGALPEVSLLVLPSDGWRVLPADLQVYPPLWRAGGWLIHWAYRINQLTRKCTGLSETANYGVSMTTITIVDSLWRHNDNCCYAKMRSQGQAFCLLTLEFKCHLRYCSSQEVDVSLSHSAVLHYIYDL